MPFRELAANILEGNPDLQGRGNVIEKEMLHYDILRAMRDSGLMTNLVFKGGTCLRLCHGAIRFSEDLDFSGGAEFGRDEFESLEDVLRRHIGERHGLEVFVNPPKGSDDKDPGSVSRWVARVVTEQRSRNSPSQRIKIEVDRRSYTHVNRLALRLNYAHLPEDYGLFPVRAAALEEILTDKLIAFPHSVWARSNPRYRDIWDIRWLTDHRRVGVNAALLLAKARENGIRNYSRALSHTLTKLAEVVASAAFSNEMQRFLPESQWRTAFAGEGLREVFEFRVREVLGEAERFVA